jgi:hypothetical protein
MSGQNGQRPVLGENVWLASLKAGALSGEFFTCPTNLETCALETFSGPI